MSQENINLSSIGVTNITSLFAQFMHYNLIQQKERNNNKEIKMI